MIEPELLAQHLEYSLWASLQVLGAARTLDDAALRADRGNSFGGIFDTLLHIYRADRIWLARFRGDQSASFVQDSDAQLDLATLAQAWPQVGEPFAAFVRTQSAAALREDLHWTNLQGVAKSEKKFKILLHVVNHGTYHRGQVITMIKQAGGAVVSTDLVYYPGM